MPVVSHHRRPDEEHHPCGRAEQQPPAAESVPLVVAVVVVALTLLLIAVLAGAARWWRGPDTDLERAVALAPADTQRWTWTDWAGVRERLGVEGSGPDAVRRLVDAGFDADLTSTSGLVESAPLLEQALGWSPLRHRVGAAGPVGRSGPSSSSGSARTPTPTPSVTASRTSATPAPTPPTGSGRAARRSSRGSTPAAG